MWSSHCRCVEKAYLLRVFNTWRSSVEASGANLKTFQGFILPQRRNDYRQGFLLKPPKLVFQV